MFTACGRPRFSDTPPELSRYLNDLLLLQTSIIFDNYQKNIHSNTNQAQSPLMNNSLFIYLFEFYDTILICHTEQHELVQTLTSFFITKQGGLFWFSTKILPWTNKVSTCRNALWRINHSLNYIARNIPMRELYFSRKRSMQ